MPIDWSNLRIVCYPDPVLKKTAAKVDEFGPQVDALARRMLELMRQAEGVGLAAPQVGLGRRLFVCNVTGEPKDDQIFVNPRFLELSGAEEKAEGCLSIPGASVTTRRATHAIIEAFTPTGERFERAGEGLLARAWQHEVDHLDGRLIIDSMSSTDEIANRRAIKQLRDDYARRR